MEELQRVTVVDVKIPFWSLVVLMFKGTLAAIPAMILLAVTAAFVSSVLGAALFGMIPTIIQAPVVSSPAPAKAPFDRRSCEDACDSTGRSVDCYANCAQQYPAKP